MALNRIISRSMKVLLAGVVMIQIAESQNVDYAGTSVANFLKIGVGARAVAMGEAYVTESSDASSLFWNPGAISRIGHGSAAFSYMPWLVDTRITYLGVVLPLSIGTFGLDFHQFSSGDMEITTLQEQDGTRRFFDATDFQLGLAYSRALTDRFSVGVKIKYLKENLAHVSADAFAFDIGSLFYTTFFGGMRVGMTLSNFGSKLTFEGRDLAVIYPITGSPSNKEVPARMSTNSWDIPLFFRMGVSTYVLRNDAVQFLLSSSIIDARDAQTRYNIGTEFGIANLIFLRGGYRFNYSESTYSAGLGLDLSSTGLAGLSFDYSLADVGRFKIVQQFTFAVQF